MSASVNTPTRYFLQAINYTVFMALIWYFASSPSIRLLENDEAMVTLAFSHAGELREPCRTMSAEELAKLPANMRKPQECPRERSPVAVEMSLNGETLYQKTFPPPGLFKDGGVNIYYSGKISAGTHTVEIKLEDNVRQDGFDYTFKQETNIAPAQILLFDFDTESGFIAK